MGKILSDADDDFDESDTSFKYDLFNVSLFQFGNVIFFVFFEFFFGVFFCSEKAVRHWQFASVVVEEGGEANTVNLCQQCYNERRV